MAAYYSNPLDYLGKNICFNDLDAQKHLGITTQNLYHGKVVAVLVPYDPQEIEYSFLIRSPEPYPDGFPREDFYDLSEMEILSTSD